MTKTERDKRIVEIWKKEGRSEAYSFCAHANMEWSFSTCREYCIKLCKDIKNE